MDTGQVYFIQRRFSNLTFEVIAVTKKGWNCPDFFRCFQVLLFKLVGDLIILFLVIIYQAD